MNDEHPEKLDLCSHDITEDKKQELLRLFPEIRTEDGKLDFERLKLALGEAVDVGKERYGMNWPGKADCFKTIQQPSLATLRPCPTESVNFETSENMIIEGDNLEVLKLLQKAYLGKVKMIYIDPPYNTGNNFIYPDNYTESLQTLDRLRREFGSRVDALAAAEIEALATADIEGVVSNSRLQELLTDHPVDITRMLQGLCEQGYLLSDNRRRWTTYRLSDGTITPSLFNGGDSSHLTGDSPHLTGDSSHLTGDSSFPADMEALRAIASPVASKGRAPEAVVRETLLRLCQGRYLTAETLAQLLTRTAPNLRSRYLSPMVAEGLLRLRYPSAANRPDQAYTTAGGNE